LHWSGGVAVAFGGRIDAISIQSALARMDVRVATRPEKFRISISVVPPGVSYIIEFQWREITIVLI
jgi:hypothetical protein